MGRFIDPPPRMLAAVDRPAASWQILSRIVDGTGARPVLSPPGALHSIEAEHGSHGCEVNGSRREASRHRAEILASRGVHESETTQAWKR